MQSVPEAKVSQESSRRLRFRLSSLLMFALLVGLMAGWARDRFLLSQAREIGKIRVEIHTDPRAFAQRLRRPLRVINFDDIATEPSEMVPRGIARYARIASPDVTRSPTGRIAIRDPSQQFPPVGPPRSSTSASKDVSDFPADRYEQLGILIKGVGRQYVGRDFGIPYDFAPASPPNAYAPGPVGKNPGGCTTEVTFLDGKSRGLVAGFGLSFIDVDFRMIKPSGLKLYDRFGNLLLAYDAIEGPNRTPVFCGLIAIDETGTPVSVIAKVEVTNGTGWPGIDAGETVTLDDFTFTVPVAFPK